jgi:dipeptidyl aminopeptidase/acylaminoacyl peptidase
VLVAVAVIAAIGLAARSVAQFLPAEEPSREQKSAIEPLYVHPLTPIESGRNDSNPVWSASGAVLAFERSRGDKKTPASPPR